MVMRFSSHLLGRTHASLGLWAPGICLAGVVVSAVPAFAITAKEAEAKVSAHLVSGAPAGGANGQAVEIQVLPPAGTKLNFDGPWKLELSGELPYKDGPTPHYGSKDFDKEKQLFRVALADGKGAATGATHGTGAYKLTYFLCDKENTWCKRSVIEGKINHAKAP